MASNNSMAADLPGIFQAFKEPDQEQSHYKIKNPGCQYHPDHVDENSVVNEKYGGYHLGKDGKPDHDPVPGRILGCQSISPAHDDMKNACLDLEEIPAVLIKTKQFKIVQWDQYQSQSNTKRMESNKDEEYLQQFQ
jgi:hypothetical protein